jgi:hypothetical protein
MKRLIVDLNYTICIALDEGQTLDPTKKYADAQPVIEVIEREGNCPFSY